MGLVEINWRPEAGELRRFGWDMIAGFGLLGLLAYLKAAHSGGWTDWSIGTLPRVLWITGVTTGLLGLSAKKAALPVYWAWMGIAFVMGNVISRLLLVLFYYGMITPMGVCMRLVGRDKLVLRRRQAATHWQDISSVNDESRYERQF
jgi:hypothetical protein